MKKREQIKLPIAIKRGAWRFAGVAAIAVLMFALNLGNIFGQSVTVDEYAHVPAGYSYLLKGDFRLYPKNPPLIKMFEALPLLVTRPEFPAEPFYESTGSWAPWEFADRFVEVNEKKFASIYASARVMTMILGVLLALVVYSWAEKIYGFRAGLLAMFLASACPNVLAHSSVATVDVGFALFFILALKYTWEFYDDGDWFSMLMAGLACGAANVSKFSGLLLFPILTIISIIYVVYAVTHSRRDQPSILAKTAVRAAIFMLTVGSLTFVSINVCYLGRGLFSPMDKVVGASSTGRDIAASAIGRIGAPLPVEYLVGLDGQLADAERGEFPNYINGRWRRKGVWYYFLESMALKMTIPSLLLILLGIGIGAARTIKPSDDPIPTRKRLPNSMFVHLPAAMFLFMASFVGNLQLGIRYVLPVLPLLYIAASSAIARPQSLIAEIEGARGWGARFASIGAVALCGLHLASTTLAESHYLSYFNEIAGGASRGHEYLLDSNLDWGQDLPALKKEMDKLGVKDIGLLYFGHADPRRYGIDYHLPMRNERFVAVSANFLHGYPYSLSYIDKWTGRPPNVMEARFIDMFVYAQSLIALKPAEIVGGSIFLYDLAGDAQ